MSSVEHYQFTCSRCDWRGDKNAVKDFIKKVYLDDEYKWIEVGRYPVRCTPCDSSYRRYKRMKVVVKRLKHLAFEYRKGWPKMVTVPLPSVPDDPRSLEEQLAEFRVMHLKWMKSHNNKTWLGGVYSTESTLKVNVASFQWPPDPDLLVCQGFLPDGTSYEFEEPRPVGSWFADKHHVHAHHAVAMSISPHQLADFSATPVKFGLGRAHISFKKKDQSPKEFEDHLAHYISKYITKSHLGVRSAQYGLLRKYKFDRETCLCKSCVWYRENKFMDSDDSQPQ